MLVHTSGQAKKYNTTKSIGTINFRVWNTYFTPLLRPSSSSLLRCWRQQDHGHSDILESYNDTLADNIAGEEEGAAITKQNNRSSEHQASFHHQHLDFRMLGLVWVWLEIYICSSTQTSYLNLEISTSFTTQVSNSMKFKFHGLYFPENLNLIKLEICTRNTYLIQNSTNSSLKSSLNLKNTFSLNSLCVLNGSFQAPWNSNSMKCVLIQH